MRSVVAYKLSAKMLFLLSNFFSMTMMICNNATKPSQVKKHRILLVLAVSNAIRLHELKFLSPQIVKRTRELFMVEEI